MFFSSFPILAVSTSQRLRGELLVFPILDDSWVFNFDDFWQSWQFWQSPMALCLCTLSHAPPPPAFFQLLLKTKAQPSIDPWVALGWPLRGAWVALA